jgi:hypothetical protein
MPPGTLKLPPDHAGATVVAVQALPAGSGFS